jgi:hypothetical protein
MTYENGACGRLYPAQTLVAARLERIAESQPTAWEGETLDGYKVHIAYRFGQVSIDVRHPANGQAGAWVWHPVGRFYPGLIEAELAARDEHDRYVRRLIATRAIVSEIRRANESEMKVAANRLTGLHALLSDRLIIRDGQLARWLDMRNSNLELLIKRGVAGGAIRVEARFAA